MIVLGPLLITTVTGATNVPADATNATGVPDDSTVIEPVRRKHKLLLLLLLLHGEANNWMIKSCIPRIINVSDWCSVGNSLTVNATEIVE